MKIKEGLMIKDVCCSGHWWEVVTRAAEWWGICQNPDCPVEKDTDYQGVNYFNTAELEDAITRAN